MIDLIIAKAHLRVDHTEDDALIMLYVDAAVDACQKYIDLPLAFFQEDGFLAITPSIKAAILLTLSDLYDNRGDGTSTHTSETVERLLDPFRRMTF